MPLQQREAVSEPAFEFDRFAAAVVGIVPAAVVGIVAAGAVAELG